MEGVQGQSLDWGQCFPLSLCHWTIYQELCQLMIKEVQTALSNFC